MIRKTVYKAVLLTGIISAMATVPAFGANVKISEARAKEIAAERAKVPADKARFTKLKLEYENVRYEYEVEFVYRGYEYEVELDADTGAILDYDVEYDD